MTTSVDKLIDGFPTPTLTRIVGMLDYESIKVVNDKLTGNAFGVCTNLGCGTVGYSRLTLTPTVYTTFSAVLFVAPPLQPWSPGCDPSRLNFHPNLRYQLRF